MFYIGLDLGTSGLKGLLINEKGEIKKEANDTYPISYFNNGWSEQDPEKWFSAAISVLNELSDGVSDEVKGVSIGGQMHGLVILDERDNVIRPAILWNDGRTQQETEYLNEIIGKGKLSEYTANIAFAGFTAPKVLWIKNNEKENFDRISKIMLPKDYLVYKFTGVHSMDYSDASGTLFLDVKNKKWSSEMLEICGIKKEVLPTLFESYQPVGKFLPEFNLKNAVVTAGAGDNAAAAIGTGTVRNGDCSISLGTSGTIFISQDKFSVDNKNSLHSFAHANGKYHLMGCILSAASCNKWWVENILNVGYDEAVENVEGLIGNNKVYFLPYLMGERSPHNDVKARGSFIGMSLDTTKEQMSLAVLEGVAFALRDCIEVARENGVDVKNAKLCGGGAKSKLWQKIIANVLNIEVCLLETEQGPAYGGAILAMVGTGLYSSVVEAADKIVNVKGVVHPDKQISARYDAKYQSFKLLYPALKEAFSKL